MAPSSLVTRTRLGALAATLAGGVLLAQASAAVAAPVTPSSTPASSTTVSSGSVVPGSAASSSAASGSGGSSSAPSAPRSSSTRSVRPAATAPPTPSDYGPPCTTNATTPNPVVCIPADSGEDQPGQLTPGDTLEFDAQVVNNSITAYSDADVVITLPKGLTLETDEDNPYRIDDWYDPNSDGTETGLTCTSTTTTTATTVTCSVKALAAHANILVGIDLQADDNVAPGTTLPFQVALAPVGTTTYAPTSVSASVVVSAPSHLVVTLTPATARVVVGKSATLRASIHNAGPGSAPDALAFAITVDQNNPKGTHFTITDGIDPTKAGNSGQIVGIIGGGTASAARARLEQRVLTRAAATARRNALPAIRFWPIGTLAPGATAQIPVTVKALSVGEDSLLVAADSDSFDPACDEGGSGSGSSSGSASPLPSAASSTSPTTAASSPSSVTSTIASSSVTPSILVRRAVASSTTAPGACQNAVTTVLTAVAAPAAASDEPLADTGTHGLGLQLGIAVWAVVIGGLLVWAGRRRFAGAHHR